MAIPTLVTKGGSLTAKDRNGDVALTGSGALRVVPMGGSLESTVNLIVNPRGAVNTSNWNGSYSTVSVGGSGSATWFRATKNTNDTVAAFNMWGTGVGRPAVTEGSPYTLAVDVRGVGLTVDVRLSWYPELLGVGTPISQVISTSIVTTNEWQRIFVTGVAPVGAKSAIPYVNCSAPSTAPIGTFFEATRIQFEEKDHATPYADGSMGLGYSWLGSPNASASMRVFGADGTPSFLVEEATTNYADNPAYAKTVNYYAGLGATKEYLEDARAPIGRAYKVTWDGAAGATAVLADTNTFFSVPGGSAWTLSLKMWSDTVGGVTCTMQINAEYTDGTTQSSVSQAPVALTSSPQTVVRTFTPNGTKTVRRLYLIPTVTSASSISVACQQWENKPYATTYTDGSLGPGYAWTGTAHASASTRAAARLFAPPDAIPTAKGAIYIRTTIPSRPGVSDILNLGVSAAGTERFVIRSNIGNGALSYINVSGGVNSPVLTTSIPFTSNQVGSVYLDWDGVSFRGRDGAGALVSGTRPSPNPSWGGSVLDMGSNGGASQTNAPVGPVLIFDRPLTDAERATLDATPTALLGWDTLIPRIGGMLRVGSPTVLAATRENHTVPIGALRVGFDDTL